MNRPLPVKDKPYKAYVAAAVSATGTLCSALGAAWLDGHLTGAEILFAVATTLGVSTAAGAGVYVKSNRS